MRLVSAFAVPGSANGGAIGANICRLRHLRYSHGPDGRWTSWRAPGWLAEEASALRLWFRLLVFRVGQPHITAKDFADPLTHHHA